MKTWYGLLLACVACAAESGPDGTLPANIAIEGKCVFASGDSQIEAGDIFVYVSHDGEGNPSVVTGIASAVLDALDDDVWRQSSSELLPARWVDTLSLEFGGLAGDRTGEAEHFIGIYKRGNEIHSAIGSTYGTPMVYPMCAFR
jgi:hypothetical protein